MTIHRIYNATVGSLLCIACLGIYAQGDGWGLLIVAGIFAAMWAVEWIRRRGE